MIRLSLSQILYKLSNYPTRLSRLTKSTLGTVLSVCSYCSFVAISEHSLHSNYDQTRLIILVSLGQRSLIATTLHQLKKMVKAKCETKCRLTDCLFCQLSRRHLSNPLSDIFFILIFLQKFIARPDSGSTEKREPRKSEPRNFVSVPKPKNL